MGKRFAGAVLAAASLHAVACSGTTHTGDPSSSGGASGSGGAVESGGAAGSAGTSASGGVSGSGGSVSSMGGAAATGGTASGGSAGAHSSTGGHAASGGAVGTGGASSDAGPPSSDGGCDDAVAQSVSWGPDGGLVRYHDTSTLDPPRAYTHSRDMLGNMLPVECKTVVEGCPSSIIADVERALADKTVTGALAAHTAYGVDSRPVDGQVFRITVGQGYFDVGSACGSGASSCRAIPAVVQALVDRLKALDTQELAKKPCTDVFP